MCGMHYHRLYRHGDVDRSARTSPVSVSAGRRYVTVYEPGHPLATKTGKVYEHRARLFDAIGPADHECHWCGTAVSWFASRFDPAELEVDHVNGVGDDNRIINLVPSCRRCNRTRATQARAAALRDAGWWSEHDTIDASIRQQRAPRISSPH